MTVLLDIELERTLDALVERFSKPEWRGFLLEAWLFEGEAARRKAELQLYHAGVTARLHSAYKPLVCHFLEHGLPSGPIRLPCHPAAEPGRFLLEAYPLAAMAEPPHEFLPGALELDYVLADGSLVFAPNRIRHDPMRSPALSPCGWLRVWRGPDLIVDERLPTEYERAHDKVMAAVTARSWSEHTPYFEVLHVEVHTGGIQRPLDVGHDCIDTQEALHEDLYFGLQTLFLSLAGRERGDRRLRMGQIVPEVFATEGPTRVKVSITRRLPDVPASGVQELDHATQALDASQIAAVMGTLPGERTVLQSLQGREVILLHREAAVRLGGIRHGLVVTAGQHANETSGVVGLLRAAPELLAGSDASVALVALENPDGYALHRRLCATHPHHMHHAARFTALGDDLEARQTAPYLETSARRFAISRTAARLHISLHGYPAQEWARPFAGYVPQGYADWMLPRGFFLIFRHHPGLRAQALRFLRALTAELAHDARLVEMNRFQLKLRQAHGQAEDALVMSDIPVRLAENTQSRVPFMMITEYPDETLTGEAFIRAHDTQRATILAAAALLWNGALD
jgi:hypothetical protein